MNEEQVSLGDHEGNIPEAVREWVGGSPLRQALLPKHLNVIIFKSNDGFFVPFKRSYFLGGTVLKIPSDVVASTDWGIGRDSPDCRCIPWDDFDRYRRYFSTSADTVGTFSIGGLLTYSVRLIFQELPELVLPSVLDIVCYPIKTQNDILKAPVDEEWKLAYLYAFASLTLGE